MSPTNPDVERSTELELAASKHGPASPSEPNCTNFHGDFVAQEGDGFVNAHLACQTSCTYLQIGVHVLQYSTGVMALDSDFQLTNCVCMPCSLSKSWTRPGQCLHFVSLIQQKQ